METQYILVASRDGSVLIHQIVVMAPFTRFDADAAINNGMVMSEDGMFWEGGATDFGVEYSLTRTGLVPNNGWWRIDPTAIPQDRSQRSKWAAQDGAIVIRAD